ncbi:hypothetical protein SARC_18220, partial [Sphaeroforma arctica JP610]
MHPRTHENPCNLHMLYPPVPGLEPCGSSGVNRTVVITFTCFPGTLGFPVSVAGGESECVSYFEWQTEAACEVQQVTGVECELIVPVSKDIIDLKDLWNINDDYE